MRRPDPHDRRICQVEITPDGPGPPRREPPPPDGVAGRPARRAPAPASWPASKRRSPSWTSWREPQPGARPGPGAARDPVQAPPPSDTFRSMRYRNFRLFFGGQLISQVGNWLTHDRPDAAGAPPHRQRLRRRAPRRLPVRSRCCSSAPGPASSPTGPTSASCCVIVQVVAMAQSFALAAWRSSASPPAARHLRGGVLAAASPRRFDNPARRAFVVEMVPPRRRPERRQPQQRHHDELPGLRPRPGRPAGGHRRLRLVLHARRSVLHRRHRRRCWMMQLGGAAAGTRDRARARARSGPGLRYARSQSRPVDPAGDDGRHRHARLQLPGRHAAVRAARTLGGGDGTFTLLYSVHQRRLAAGRTRHGSAGHRRGLDT